MVTLTSPGVYIQEVPSGVHTITGVSTSIAAFFGRTAKGPMDKAVRVLSLSDYTRSFGAPHPESDLAESVRQFFANGGTDCYVVRLAAGADTANVTLRDRSSRNVMTASAKYPGALGNGLRLEVSYDTARPDDTFTLTVIQEDGGVEVAREDHTGLSMNPNSPRFARDFVSQSSALVDLVLHADAAPGGASDLADLANSFAGFSQGRVFGTAPIGPFRAAVEGLLTATPRFEMSVDEGPYIPIDLASVLGAPAPAIAPGSAWSLGAMAARLTQVMNEQLGAVSVGLSVACSWQTSGNFAALRITSDTADPKSLRIRRAAGQDFAAPMMLGIDQGGVEAARYSDFRPVPTAAFFHDVDDLVDLAALERDDIVSLAIDGAAPIGFSFAAMTPAATDPWFLDSSGNADGVREKLTAIAQAVNNDAASDWRAEVWGYHLALIAKDGSINKTAATVVSAGDVFLGGANFTRNVRLYALGNTGTGGFQQLVPPGTLGIDGSAPGLGEYQGNQAAQTGFHALDSVDIFNLMILPPDRGPGAADRAQLWGPASNYCAGHRAFLLVDPPDDWTNNGRPVATATEVNTLRAPIVNDYAAAFYPRVRYSDRGILKYTGASGAIAGLMARTDSTRGVWKAPAGVEADLRAIVDLEVKLTDGENGVLNKLGVNCLRQFPSGFVNWGARTLDGADDFGSEWKYVPIRRFALFLEESLFRGTKWIVFEPNDEPLWAKIRMNLNGFMMGLFRQGAFQGGTPDQAFFVKCDAETTTQNDRNLGIVNIEVGFAPLKPAEFVIIKIQQIAGDLG
jgi:phage tail sheath protein FI